MVKISERLRTAAGLIGEGERLADVGTDHGYVPIYLVERKHIPSAIAMDIRTGPLERAREHIRMYGMEDYIQTRLSDGVAALKPGEADWSNIFWRAGESSVSRHMGWFCSRSQSFRRCGVF